MGTISVPSYRIFRRGYFNGACCLGDNNLAGITTDRACSHRTIKMAEKMKDKAIDIMPIVARVFLGVGCYEN